MILQKQARAKYTRHHMKYDSGIRYDLMSVDYDVVLAPHNHLKATMERRHVSLKNMAVHQGSSCSSPL
jgi:hypothetical protein